VPEYWRCTPAPRAFLQESGVIDDQDTVAVGEVVHDVVAQVVTDRVNVPVGGSQQPLHPIRADLTGELRQRLAVLAFQPSQQAVNIGQYSVAWFRTREPCRDPLMQLCQPCRPHFKIYIRHET
jgi:hypothetical protein